MQVQSAANLIAILGGTFDPIHNGHIQVALDAGRSLGVQQVSLMPCYLPVHGKTPAISIDHRLQMLNALCQSIPQLTVDDREVRRALPSYTIDSVRELRLEKGDNTSIVWIVGWDSLQAFTSWHQWRQIFDFANLAVVRRPGFAGLNNLQLEDFLSNRWVEVQCLANYPKGKIALLDTLEVDLASRAIRKKIAAGESVVDDVPQIIWQYIQEHNLYRFN